MDTAAGLLCMLVALALAVAPHVAAFAQYGRAEYLADVDDVTYLAVGRAPFYGESGLRDPFSGRWENVPTNYSWFQFVPLARATAVLGLPATQMNIVWRVVGGMLLGAVLFVLFRQLFAAAKHPTAWALGCSLICLADAGFVTGRALVQSFALLPHLWSGTTPLPKADALAQYRVVTPILNLPFLLLLAASLLSGWGWRTRAVAGIASLGMCFLLYFYFWTAAVLALGIYFVWLLLRAWKQPGRRQVNLSEARLVAVVLVGGMAIGAPQIVSNAMTFADPEYQVILRRIYKGYPLAADDPIRYAYLRNFWVWIHLAIGAVGIFVLRHAGLVLLWSFTFAAYVLKNSAIVTGLEFENTHWSYVHGPMGTILLLATVGLLLDRGSDGRSDQLRPLWTVPAALLLIAAVWRPYEALHAPDAVRNTRLLQELRPIKPELARLSGDCALAGPPATNVAILLSRAAQLYQHPYTMSVSMIPDSVVHQRHALNGWLQGMDLPAYTEAARKQYRGDFIGRPQWSSERVLQARTEIFKEFQDGKRAEIYLARFRPCYMLLPTTAPAPERGGYWRVLGKSAEWTLWGAPARGGSIH